MGAEGERIESATADGHGVSYEELCGYCGEVLVEGANFCHRCGAQVLRDGQLRTPPAHPVPPRRSLRLPADERLLWEGAPSLRIFAVLFVNTAILASFALGLLLLIDPTPEPLPTAILITAAVAVFVLRSVRPWYRCVTHHYRLTNRALWVRSGLFKEVVDRYGLHEFLSLSVSRSLLQRLFNVGSIELHFVRPSQAPIVLFYVSDPDRLAAMLSQAMMEAAAERALLSRSGSEH